MIKTQRIYQFLMIDKEFVDWIDRQTNKTKDKVSNLNLSTSCEHTNLVLRESLDDTLRDLLPWDIELVIDEPDDEKEEEPED